MIPGAVSLALLRLTTLKLPQPWAEFSTGSGDAVLLPLLYAGLAYMIGTVLEVLLNPPLERIYVRAFASASKTHAWIHDASQHANREVKSAEYLSRASFGQLIVATSEKENQIISHIVRFHSEAKMCFAVSALLSGFLALVAIQTGSCIAVIKPVEHNIVWCFILVLVIPALVYATYNRLESRARFMLRAIERLADENGSPALITLRNQLRAFAQNK